MAALLALIPFRDWVWAAIVATLLGAGTYEYFHLQAIGAAREKAALVAGEKKASDAAQKQLTDNQADYNTKLKASQDAYNVQIQTAQSLAADLSGRLRAYEASRCPSGVLQGAAAPAAPGPASPGSARGVEQAVAALIAAAAHDNAVIGNERAERDALTGK